MVEIVQTHFLYFLKNQIGYFRLLAYCSESSMDGSFDNITSKKINSIIFVDFYELQKLLPSPFLF